MDQKWDLSRLQRKYLKVETITDIESNHNQTQVSGVNDVETIDLEKSRKFGIQIQPERSKSIDESNPLYSSVLNLERTREEWGSPNSKVFGRNDRSTSSSSVLENEALKEFQSPLQKIGMSLIDDDDSDSGNGKDMEEPEPDAAASDDDNSAAPQPYCIITSVSGAGTAAATDSAAAAAADDDDGYDDDEYTTMIITYRCSDCKTECSSEEEVQDHRMTCPSALEAMRQRDS